MILRARAVLPISRPPIENGAVLISENRITRVGRWNDFSPEKTDGEIFDLGDSVLLPGLVNAHCHLDYTNMAGLWPPPKTFVDWIPLMLAAKAEWSYTDYAKSWLNGAQMLLHNGTTTVADIEAVPELLPDVWNATPLRVFSFLEMTGIRARREPREILHEAVEKIDSLSHNRNRILLSPHAPYSTSPELLRLCAEAAREKKIRVTTHVAESEQEFEMFAHAHGEMFHWLQRNGRDTNDCGFGSPVQHLERAGLFGENHANVLAPGDAGLLGKHGVHVVHCPRSHDYFGHPRFPRKQLTEAGVNICLGTDSLATTRSVGKEKPELNLFEEMRMLAVNDRELLPKEILQMATINGARALGMSGQIGELSEDAFADLIAITFAGKITDIYDTVLHHSGNIATRMIDGQWAIAP
jgi:cytosine/adenosine deaminase-related metal-dependent hydrolase